MLQWIIIFSKYLAVISAMDGVDFELYSVRCNCTLSILTLNMWSTWYLQLSGIFSECPSSCVVSFSVSLACATLIPHRLLKYYVVVFECWSADRKSCGCLILVRFFGGSVTLSMWMSFTSCSVTILATCRCFSLVALFIAIACFPDIRTLFTSLWLKCSVLNMMSSSSTIWHSLSAIDWWNLIPILDRFRASVSSFT